jgi:hypothetical protein
VASIDPLPLPFASWQEGLFALADGLSDPGREKIMVARLEATAAKSPIGLKEICALALLVPSAAHFDRENVPKYEPDPTAVALGQMVRNETFNKALQENIEAHHRMERARQEEIPAAFPEGDPRRLLKDTILGFPAALLADVSQQLGDADPFLRIARRLSLWFKPSREFSRYGLPLAADGRAVANGVLCLADSIPGDGAKRSQRRLLAIWAGKVSVEATDEGVHEILSLLFQSPRQDVGGLDAVLGLEICGALAEEIDSLDVGTIEALFKAMKSIHDDLDDGRPGTSIFRTWLGTWSERGERFRLTYDPSRAFGSTKYLELNGDALEPLRTTTLKDISQGGHAIFATGPFPMRGVLFGRKGPLSDALSKQAPEAADLYRLLSVDGDYDDTIGPFPDHFYWTGEDTDPTAIIFPDAIDRARERGDHALSDMLIGCWTLFCVLFQQAPLPDLVGLAQRINALPLDYRASIYAVLGLLKREAATIDRIRRDMDALLSWLPLVDMAPPEDFEAFMRDLFSAPLWSSLEEKERQRLVESEESFVTLRRLPSLQREGERFRHMIVDWSAITELILRRARDSLPGARVSRSQPLGVTIGEVRNGLTAYSKNSTRREQRRCSQVLAALHVLELLNHLNIQGGKHLGGDEITWEDVVYVHAGLYWALRALLELSTTGIVERSPTI